MHSLWKTLGLALSDPTRLSEISALCDINESGSPALHGHLMLKFKVTLSRFELGEVNRLFHNGATTLPVAQAIAAAIQNKPSDLTDDFYVCLGIFCIDGLFLDQCSFLSNNQAALKVFLEAYRLAPADLQLMINSLLVPGIIGKFRPNQTPPEISGLKGFNGLGWKRPNILSNDFIKCPTGLMHSSDYSHQNEDIDENVWRALQSASKNGLNALLIDLEQSFLDGEDSYTELLSKI